MPGGNQRTTAVARAIREDAAARGMSVPAFLQQVYTLWSMEQRRERAAQMQEPVRYVTHETEMPLPVAGLNFKKGWV